MKRPTRGTEPAADWPNRPLGQASSLVIPDYGGACITEIVPTIFSRRALLENGALPPWFGTALGEVDQIVLLVLDGLGFEQLLYRASIAPNLSGMLGGPITSVAPTTTAAALTSIATGVAPSVHGVLGYRVNVHGEILNILRWTTARGDAREAIPPNEFQRHAPFLGNPTAIVSRTEFERSGFSDAHLRGMELCGWKVPSSLAVNVRSELRRGAQLTYAYYDGMDKVAHEHGLDEHYDAELVATDRLVGELLEVLPRRAGLVVTSDHGQVVVDGPPIVLSNDVTENVRYMSGEGRFRWLHAKEGRTQAVKDACLEHYEDVATVVSRDEVVESKWLGGSLSEEFADRLGDVALIARSPIAFFDPNDTGDSRLIARHGALTSAEVSVPFLSYTR